MNAFVATINQLGPVRLGIMGAIIIALIMFFLFISLRISTPEMKLLYSDLSSTDSGAVAAKLEETQIPYQISPDGSRIVVPKNEVGRARMLLAEAGLPNGGSMGYKIFDEQTGFGTTNFVQNINQVRALEGELARTISSVENVRSARVHIVLPQRELFSRDNRQSSASVFLGVRPGAVLERPQVLSIQSLVASAVPNLKTSNVSIVDSNGNLLAKGGNEETDLLNLKAEEMRRDYESRLIQKIEQQVSRIVGYGKVTAIVTADMNFDRVSTNEELYNPEGQVLRSSQVTSEQSTERTSASGDVSVENNLPGAGGGLLLDQQPSAENNTTEEVSNYEISKTVRNIVSEVGEVKKLSVSVLVDGRYNKDEEGNEVYEPRSQAELDQISALVRTAVALDDERGDTMEVVNMQFAQVDTAEEIVDDRFLLGFEKSDLIDAAEVMTVSVMVILVILLVVQPMVSRIMAIEIPSLDDSLETNLLSVSSSNPALSAPKGAAEEAEDTMVDVQGVEGKVKASSMKKVEEIVENYPNETVSVIRSWMTQEG